MNKNKTDKQIKIMIVEDHDLTRIGLKVSLEKKEGIKIIGESDSGSKAIKIAKEIEPDLIIMDIGLKDIDGIASTKEIKKNNPNIRVIMLTSHEAENEILASLSSGADGYCLKETPFEQLYNAVLSVNEGNVWLSSQIAEKVLRKICGQTINTNKVNAIPIIPLSERELEVLHCIVNGKSNQDIADDLFLTLATVKTHVRNILNKLSVDDRTQAAVKAMREGIVS